MARRCSLQVVVPFKQKEAHLVGKSLALAGIIMMKMVFDQLVKRISTALPITLIKNGIMQTGWSLIEGHWNYFASSGAMKTGWVKDKDTWYYLDKEGVMLTGLKRLMVLAIISMQVALCIQVGNGSITIITTS